MRSALLALILLAGCAPVSPEPPSPTPVAATLSGRVTACPTCAVVENPPDPACEDVAVGGALLLLLGAGDEEIARATSDADGRYSLTVPGGRYRLVPQPVDGLLGTAAAIAVTLEVGENQTVPITYDTGIRIPDGP